MSINYELELKKAVKQQEMAKETLMYKLSELKMKSTEIKKCNLKLNELGVKLPVDMNTLSDKVSNLSFDTLDSITEEDILSLKNTSNTLTEYIYKIESQIREELHLDNKPSQANNSLLD